MRLLESKIMLWIFNGVSFENISVCYVHIYGNYTKIIDEK